MTPLPPLHSPPDPDTRATSLVAGGALLLGLALVLGVLAAILHRCSATPRPQADPVWCAQHAYPHEVILPDGGVGVCGEDPMAPWPVSDHPGLMLRRDAGVRR